MATLEELIKQNEEVKKEIKDQADSLNRIKAEVEVAVAEKKKADSEAIEASMALEEVKTQLEEEKAKLPPLVEEGKELMKEVKKAHEEVETCKKEVEAKKTELKTLEADMTKFILDNREAEKANKKAFDAEIVGLEDRKSKVADDLKAIEAKKATKQKEVEGIEGRIPALEEQISSLQAEIAKLDTLLKQNQDALTRAISAQKAIANTIGEAETQRESLLEDVKVAKGLKIDAENELASVKEELAGQLALRIQIGQQREDLNTREAYLKDLYQKAGITR